MAHVRGKAVQCKTAHRRFFFGSTLAFCKACICRRYMGPDQIAVSSLVSHCPKESSPKTPLTGERGFPIGLAPWVATAGDPARGAPAGPVFDAGPPVALSARRPGGPLPVIQLAPLRRGMCLLLAHQLPIGSVPWVATAGDPAGPMPAAGARAADELGAQGDHCR